jgi:hypothetical protein|tara:strand:+ start:392 stop:559 length:168 start_codon:yes stop_codon:yes gene_type:complete
MKILLFLLGLLGANSDKSFDGTSLIVNKVIKGVYDEKRVETVAYNQEKYPKNKLD